MDFKRLIILFILTIALFLGLTGCFKNGGSSGNRSPLAFFTTSSTEDPSLEILFDASDSNDPDGVIVTYDWDFGDGNTGNGEIVSHVYESEGNYQVTLTVTDDQGARDTNTETIFVSLGNAGSVKWKFSTGHEIHSSPAIGDDGTIYVGSDDHKLYAINPNGIKKWEFSTRSPVRFSPALGIDGTIYISTLEGTLYAVNPDGSKKWEFSTEGYTWSYLGSALAISSNGTIYISTHEGTLYAINPNGTKKWEFSTGGGASSPAIGSDGTIYIGTTNGLIAINPDGTAKWTFDTAGSSPLAIDSDGTIYVVGHDGHSLVAVSSDGTAKWTFTTGDMVYSSPAIGDDGTIYVGTGHNMAFDDKLYAINPDGTAKWTFTTGGDVTPSPAIGADGTIYAGSNYHALYFHVYAINPDGSKKWELSTGEYMASSPAIGSDGTIYIGSGDTLYAITGESGGLANTPWPKFQHDLRNIGRAE